MPLHHLCFLAAGVVTVLVYAVGRHRKRARAFQCESLAFEVTTPAVGTKQVQVALLPLCCADAEQVLAAAMQLTTAHILGLDCEWQPERGSQHSPVSLLQLCAGNTCYLAQLLHMDDVPSQLRFLLQNPLVVKVGVGIREDIRRLAQDYGIRVASAVDLVDVIKAAQPAVLATGSGLAALSRTLLGLQVDKTLQCSDWGSKCLTKPQLAYAALDAWVSLQLAQQLHPFLSESQPQQQLATADEQQQQQVQQDLGQVDKTLAWLPKGNLGAGNRCRSSVRHAAASDSASPGSGGAAGELEPWVQLSELLRPFALKQRSGWAGPLMPSTQIFARQQQQQERRVQQLNNPGGLQRGPKLPARRARPDVHLTQQQQQQLQRCQQQAAALVLHLKQQLPALPLGHQALQLWQTSWRIMLLHHHQQAEDALLQSRQQLRQARRLLKLQHGQFCSSTSGSVAQQQQQQQQVQQQQYQHAGMVTDTVQQRRQEQVEQLQRLGLQVSVPRRSIYDRLHQLKPARLPTRKSLQYENCRILSPEGVALATCGLKKIKWYLEHDLAELVSDEPAVIRLKFTPKGSGHADDAYYLSDKENQCVVCGHTGEYLRHSIVPHCYRSHFPPHMKSHLSHDIVLMCPGCHQIANIAAQARMQELGEQYGAPLQDSAKRFQTDRQLSAVRSAAKALAGKAAMHIPPARRAELQAVILRYFGRENQPWPSKPAEQQQLLDAALAVEPKVPSEGWQSHAAVVVGAVTGIHAAFEQQQQQQQQQPQTQPQPQDPTHQQQLPPFDHYAAASTVPQASRATLRLAAAGLPAACAAATTSDWPSSGRPVLEDHAAGPHASPCWLVAAAGVLQGAGAVAAAGAAAAAGIDVRPSTALLAVPALCPVSSTDSAAAAAAGANGASYQWSPDGDGLLMCSDGHELSKQWQGGQAQLSPAQPCHWPRSLTAAMAYGFGTWTVAILAAAAAAARPAGSASAKAADSTAAELAGSEGIAQSSQAGADTQTAGAASGAAAGTAAGGGLFVLQLSPAGEEALEEFVRSWRRHFLQVMQPKFLPPYWSVDSRVKNSSAPAHHLEDTLHHGS